MSLKLPLDTIYPGLGKIEHTRILSGMTPDLCSIVNDKLVVKRFYYRIVKFNSVTGEHDNISDVIYPGGEFTVAELRAALVARSDDPWDSLGPTGVTTLWIGFDNAGKLITIAGWWTPTAQERTDNMIIGLTLSTTTNFITCYQNVYNNSPTSEIAHSFGSINVRGVNIQPVPGTLKLKIPEIELLVRHIGADGTNLIKFPAREFTSIQQSLLNRLIVNGTPFVNPRLIHNPTNTGIDTANPVGDNEATIVHAFLGQSTGTVRYSVGSNRFNSLLDAINNAWKTVSEIQQYFTSFQNLTYVGSFAMVGSATDLSDRTQARFGFYDPKLQDIVFYGDNNEDDIDYTRIVEGHTPTLCTLTTGGNLEVGNFIYQIVKFESTDIKPVVIRKHHLKQQYTIQDVINSFNPTSPTDVNPWLIPGTRSSVWFGFDVNGKLICIPGNRQPTAVEMKRFMLIGLIISDGITIFIIKSAVHNASPASEVIDALQGINVDGVNVQPNKNSLTLSLPETKIAVRYTDAAGSNVVRFPAMPVIQPMVHVTRDLQVINSPNNNFNTRLIHVANSNDIDTTNPLQDTEAAYTHVFIAQVTGIVRFTVPLARFASLRDAMDNSWKAIPFITHYIEALDPYTYIGSFVYTGATTDLSDRTQARFGRYEPKLQDIVFYGDKESSVDYTRIIQGYSPDLIKLVNGKLQVGEFTYRISKLNPITGARETTIDVTHKTTEYTIAELRAAIVNPEDDGWLTSPGIVGGLQVGFDEKGKLATFTAIHNPTTTQRNNYMIVSFIISSDGVTNIIRAFPTIYDGSDVTEIIDAIGVINTNNVSVEPISGGMRLKVAEIGLYTRYKNAQNNHNVTFAARDPIPTITQRFGDLSSLPGPVISTLNPRGVHIENTFSQDPVSVKDDEVTFIHMFVGAITGTIVTLFGHIRYSSLSHAETEAHREVPHLKRLLKAWDNYTYLNSVTVRGAATNLGDVTHAKFCRYVPERDGFAFPRLLTTANNLSVVPTGNLSSTNVQAALEEHQLDINLLTSLGAANFTAYSTNPTAADGQDGEFALNAVSGDVIGPKTAGNWPTVVLGNAYQTALSSTTPLALTATASVGTSNQAARADHTHNGTLGILTDVDIATAAPKSGDSLMWNGTKWVPKPSQTVTWNTTNNVLTINQGDGTEVVADVGAALNLKADKFQVEIIDGNVGEHTVILKKKADIGSDGKVLPSQLPPMDLTSINAAMATKANTTDVDEALALKADKTYVDTQVNLKVNVVDKATTADIAIGADNRWVDSSGLKTVIDSVNAATNLKADKTALDAAKKDISDINTAVSQNITAINAAIDTKANTTTVNVALSDLQKDIDFNINQTRVYVDETVANAVSNEAIRATTVEATKASDADLTDAKTRITTLENTHEVVVSDGAPDVPTYSAIWAKPVRKNVPIKYRTFRLSVANLTANCNYTAKYTFHNTEGKAVQAFGTSAVIGPQVDDKVAGTSHQECKLGGTGVTAYDFTIAYATDTAIDYITVDWTAFTDAAGNMAATPTNGFRVTLQETTNNKTLLSSLLVSSTTYKKGPVRFDINDSSLQVTNYEEYTNVNGSWIPQEIDITAQLNLKADVSELTNLATKAELATVEALKADATALTAEITRATAAEALKANIADLTAEINRATAVEALKANIADLTAETTRATAVEALKANITDLTAEITRATAVETATNLLVNKGRLITKTAHGFTVGMPLGLDPAGDWFKCDNSSADNAEVIGVVSVVVDANTFRLKTEGFIDGLSIGVVGVYFVGATPGTLVSTLPVAPQLHKPVLIRDTTTTGYIIHRPTTVM